MADGAGPLRSTEADAFTHSLTADGYALIDLSGDEYALRLCDEANAQMEAWHGRGFNRVQDAWRRAPAVRALASLPQIAAALERAYGAKPFPFQTLNFLMGSQQRAHADTIHFTQEPAHLMCGVWLALEDAREEAGPLFYYPGSHKLPVMDLKGAGAPDAADPIAAYRSFYEPAMAARLQRGGFTRRIALLKKGQALVWAANLAHGGTPVTDRGMTRRSLVTHYFFQGGDYYTLMHSGAGGRRHYRLPTDIRTGRFVWPRRGRPALKTIAAAARARIARTVHTFGALSPLPQTQPDPARDRGM
ncbi:MAG: phytanoyl-CoA dioxygenase family protein [Hyphomonadaceae bacterium]